MASFRRLSYGLILLSPLLMSPAKADDNIRSITEQFVLGVLSAHDPGGALSQESSITDDQLEDLAEERARALVDNVRSQTDTVLGVAIPDSIASRIDASLLEYVEEYSELEGHLTATFVEYDDFSRAYQIALQPTDASDTIFLHFDRPPPDLPVGHLVRVRGVLLARGSETGGSARHMVLRSDDDALEIVSGADVITAPPSVGPQRTGVFVVDFSDEPVFLEDATYDKEWRQLKDLVRRDSLGRAWLSVERVGKVELPTAPTCDTRSIQTHFDQALTKFDRSTEYDRVFAIMPRLECGWRTQTAFPGSPTVVLVAGEPDTKLMLRALLHSLGMPGDGAHSCDFDTVHSECQEGTEPEPEYLRGVGAISVSPFHKESVGWTGVDQANGIRTVEASGSYRVFASDYTNRKRWMALKLKRPAPLSELETTYYIEYRTRRTARGERQEPEVVVYIVSGSRATDVVNLTFPDPVSVELNDAIAVSVGRFVDHAAGLEIEVVNTYPWAVDLHISFDPTSCVRAAPAIKAAPRETPYLLADSTIPFSLALTSRDSENCGPSRPNLHLQAPGGWNVQQDSETSMLQPGGTVHMEVSVTIPSSEAPGFRDLEWSVEGHALIEAHRATMLFVKPSTGDMPTTDPIPEPTRTINVSSSTQLSSALSSAQPGDHIVLANGSYSGFTVSKSGQDGKPIVVRAATTGGARIGGHITIEGDHVWVVGTNMAANTIFVKGNFSRISKNFFDQHQKTGWAGISVDRAITNAEIDHNEHAGGATGHDAIDVRVACDKKHNHYIHHNYIHDSTGDGDGIGVGFGNSCDGNSRIEYNLITNWKGKYCMYEKGGANTWAFNTCIGPGLGAESRGFSRETLTNSTIGSTRNEWIANWFEGASANLRIFGAHNRVIGNNMNSGKVQLGCGNFRLGEPSNNPSEHKGYVAATDNLVAGNKGNLTVGVIYSGVCEGTAFNGNSYPAKDNKVQAHQGNITYGKHQGTNVTANTSVTVPQAKKLTPSQVGPNAPTAPKL